jgi:hypothetical protein
MNSGRSTLGTKFVGRREGEREDGETRSLGLGSMCGHWENAENINTKITQPLKKLAILWWFSSTSQA